MKKKIAICALSLCSCLIVAGLVKTILHIDKCKVSMIFNINDMLVPASHRNKLIIPALNVSIYSLTEAEWRQAKQLQAEMEKASSLERSCRKLSGYLWTVIFKENPRQLSCEARLEGGRGEVWLKSGKYAAFSTPNILDEGPGWAMFEIPNNVKQYTVSALQWYDPDQV